jgi:hypothetical protein
MLEQSPGDLDVTEGVVGTREREGDAAEGLDLQPLVILGLHEHGATLGACVGPLHDVVVR